MLTEKRLGMDTTCGTAALIGAKGRQNADVVDAVREESSHDRILDTELIEADSQSRHDHYRQGESLGMSPVQQSADVRLTPPRS